MKDEHGDELSGWARSLHREWESPELWPRIRESLAAESRRRLTWKRWAAAAAVLVVVVSAWWFRPAPPSHDVLTEQALKEADAAEVAYVRSIERLSALAAPVLRSNTAPVMAVYREKLRLLDGAIAEVRAAAAENRLNVPVQQELVSLYHEKQQTLQEVLRYANSQPRKS